MTGSGTEENSSGQIPLPLRVGCTFQFEVNQHTSSIMQMAPRPEPGLSIRDELWAADAYHYTYVDSFGNRCERFELPPGPATVIYEAHVVVARPVDVIARGAHETPVGRLPDDVLNFLMPSRFCLSDELGAEAWQRFGALAPGWDRVQADRRLRARLPDLHPRGLESLDHPRSTPTGPRQGVCRDFAHLAITFCRALNIPARYVFGYIPDVGVPPPEDPMDFCAWFEVYLDGSWHTFDARNNIQRSGRVIVGRGRDAVDVRADHVVRTAEPHRLRGPRRRATRCPNRCCPSGSVRCGDAERGPGPGG